MFARVTAFLIFLLAPIVSFAAPPIGTMSGEVRDRDKHIDIARTIDALVRLKVNTYYYLIWQSERDWDDLPAFADAAAKQNIDVWAYVVPWSETPLKKTAGWGFSEPFRTDYIAWASEIAKLSLAHPNIRGYVIDDFYDNTTEGHFTPTYVKKMVAAGTRINPKIKFCPLMYFQTPWVEFVNRFANIVDGVVICYPKSEGGIRNAATYLADKRHGPSAIIQLGRHKGAERGDGGYAIADVDITDPSQAEVSFYYDVTDQLEGDSSLQSARVKIDGRTVWQSPTEGRMRDAIINIDLSRALRRPQRVRIQFEVVTYRTGVPELLPVIVRFDDIRVYGAGRNPSQFLTDLELRGRPLGKFDVSIMPGSHETGRFNLPIILMPPGEPDSYEKRYDVKATPQGVGKRLRLCLAMVNQGVVEGVVPYRTPLFPDDPYFQAVQTEFNSFWQQADKATNDTNGHQ
jgi:hypothetical protein